MGVQDLSAPATACFPAIQKMTGLAARDKEGLSFPLVGSVTPRSVHKLFCLCSAEAAVTLLSQSDAGSVYCLQSCVTT